MSHVYDKQRSEVDSFLYDEEFINSILNGELDTYGENSATDITIDDIDKGKENFYRANDKMIKELINKL